MTESEHYGSNAESRPPFPSSSTSTRSNPPFTSQRGNMNYFTLAGVCKRTCYTEEKLPVFVIKRKTDNALYFDVNTPSSYKGDPENFVDMRYNRKRNETSSVVPIFRQDDLIMISFFGIELVTRNHTGVSISHYCTYCACTRVYSHLLSCTRMNS